MKETRKTGISLIVMLITIVVIIILAASIVNTVIYNNPMDNAKEATFRSDLQEIKNAYGIRQGDLMAKYKGDRSKITEADYAGVVHRNYEGEIAAFDVGLAYLGEDKQKQEIAESMDYIIGNPNDSVLKRWTSWTSQDDFHNDEYRAKITKIKFITNNKVPKEVVEYWDVSEKNNGAVMAWVVDDGNGGYELTIGGNGKIIANEYSTYLFRDFIGVKEIDIKLLDTSNVILMTDMFYGCSNLASLDVSNFNTSNVTDTMSMFRECISLTNLDVSNFDTSKIINFQGMFNGCSSLTNLDVSNFNTKSANSISIMFSGCRNLTSLNVSNFDTSNVTDMQNMFSGCSNLTNLDVSNFDTSKVINMRNMFSGCSNLTNIDLGEKFNTAEVTNMNNMFRNCEKLKASITIKNVDTTEYSDMFLNAATRNGAEIKVNYTSETSDLVNEMIKTKSEKSNVIKGELVSN